MVLDGLYFCLETENCSTQKKQKKKFVPEISFKSGLKGVTKLQQKMNEIICSSKVPELKQSFNEKQNP